MELKQLNRANEIVDELGRIKRVMPSKTEHRIDRDQIMDITRLVMKHQEEFCEILLKGIELLEKEFNEL